MWCLVSWVLISATFLQAPARFQPCQPFDLSDWWLGQVGAEEPQNEQGGASPDGILGSLSGQRSHFQDSWALTGLIRGTGQLTRNGHKIRWGPEAGSQSGNPTPAHRRGDWSPPWGSWEGSIRQGDLGAWEKGGIVITSEWLYMHDCWLEEVKVSSTVLRLQSLRGSKTCGSVTT